MVLGLLQGHLDSVISFCFDETFNLYSTSFDGAIKRWNMASQRVAFSFEDRNDSVTAIAAFKNGLFVGIKRGTMLVFNIENAMVRNVLNDHRKAIAQIVTFNGTIYSSGLDGLIMKYSPVNYNYNSTVISSESEKLKGLAANNLFIFSITDEARIVFVSRNNGTRLYIDTGFQTPLVCLAATDDYILAGSRSGIIFSWSITTREIAF